MGGKHPKLAWPEIRMEGKTVVVTGANSGIGFETAKHLAMLGARVIIACRSETRGKAAILRMQADYMETKMELLGEEQADAGSELQVEFMKLDLASLKSVNEFADEFKAKEYPLHILINNAGIAFGNKGFTEDGFESHFQVNYLSHFLLTLRMLPIMRESGDDCRIIMVASQNHKDGSLDISNIQAQRNYDRSKFYANSKLFMIMMMYSLEKRLRDTNINVFAVHPGTVNTSLSKSFEDSSFYKMGWNMHKRLGWMTDSTHGAATTINTAISPHIKELRGYYFIDCSPVTPSSKSRNEKDQEVLWNYSVECLKSNLDLTLLQGLDLPEPEEEE